MADVNVEIGAGARTAPDYLAVDVNPKHADVIADALRLPFADRSVHQLRAVDVLEHISWRQTDDALREWRRVLRASGSLFVQVPDAATIMHWYVERNSRLGVFGADRQPGPLIVGAAWRLLGGHCDGQYVDEDDDWRWNAHYALFDEPYLRDRLEGAGFKVDRIERNQHPNLFAWAHR